MKTWTIHYTAKINENTKLDYTFSVSTRDPITKVAAKQLARDHVEPILHRRINLTDLNVNWIRHTAA